MAQINISFGQKTIIAVFVANIYPMAELEATSAFSKERNIRCACIEIRGHQNPPKNVLNDSVDSPRL